ncbi:NLP/P60 protein [Cellulomonas flavigena DSM 20109]|uniref:NLP/P60 protein n=1 Tax=Cellulomonas flavigena (strain ATCC 482 / DSM 20109 / BCRC 11376 / JCM 18109 / NBRC 3775 / NCIMB 8073 / NRS 134) TaxID=446466 RepID=D5UG11_CELFN|nr:NlpC/P60 family protein [Cellulomonas flavigena]ADG75034.1 NLP/P60 protein [Cellulomonas flavigena DSM 20109]
MVVVLGAGLVVGLAPAAGAEAGTSRLRVGERLSAGQWLASPGGNLRLEMQHDGNLVLYAPGGNPRWHTHTDGNAGAWLTMQSDGNLVLYSADNRALWNSQTPGSGGSFVQVQDDGNVVVYTAQPRAVWQSGTTYHPSRITTGQTLPAGQRLQSPNGAYEAVMQSDGNFVLYGPTGWMWQSGTSGTGATRLAVQTDGNLVLYDAAGRWTWQSGTAGRGAGFLQVQDDGNLVMYDAASRWTWQSYTYPGYQPPTVPRATPGEVAVAFATQQIGKPYVWGATGPNAYDCSGLTLKAWAAAGVAIPRTSAGQYAGLPRVPRSQARPGDIVAWASGGQISHVAIYVGDNKIIEAANRTTGVRLGTIWGTPQPYVLRPAG